MSNKTASPEKMYMFLWTNPKDRYPAGSPASASCAVLCFAPSVERAREELQRTLPKEWLAWAQWASAGSPHRCAVVDGVPNIEAYAIGRY